MSFAITATVTSVASIGLGIYGSMQQASAQRKAGKYAAESGGREQAQAEYEAANILEASKREAGKVRSQAISARGTQMATAAASGVLVGDGSVQAMVDEVTNLAEQDAVAVLWDGANGFISSTEKGRLANMEGQFRSKQANLEANSTLISGYAKALGTIGSMAADRAAGGGGGGGSKPNTGGKGK